MNDKIKKLKHFIIKHDELFFIILFLVMILGYGLNVKTISGDEVWNFMNSFKIYNGYKIYVDANIITTPMFFVITVIIFKIFGCNFFVFRIYNIITCLCIFLMGYKILKKLDLRKKNAFFIMIIIFFFERSIIYNMANYNTLALLFCLIGFYIILIKQNIKKYWLIESIFIGLIFLTKQNIGIFYLCGYILYSLINKEKFTDFIKIITNFLFIVALFLFILVKLNCFYGFIDYCILGLKDFSAMNKYFDVKYTLILICVVFFNISFIIYSIFVYNIKQVKENKNLHIIIPFSFTLLLISYPILNESHIITSLFLQLIIFWYFINVFFIKKHIYNDFLKYISIVLIIFLASSSLKHTYDYFKIIINDNNSYKDIYFGTIISEDLNEKINKVDDFILNSNKKVILISIDAGIINMPLNISNGCFDLPLLGNLGKGGENKLINEIINMNDVYILINEKKGSLQESDRIRNYIINNLKFVGNIDDILIYEKSK